MAETFQVAAIGEQGPFTLVVHDVIYVGGSHP